ncbi:hypothetical protein HNY73_022837 [Argiope bruennichi]|uniref:Uncharacterized protein n=1 Tax=Argiope bruennichi TaxID=94029 RepID=A0A8T0E4I3_ARGBR|nr:hypothetical protein HNY73_022837 [Argiope bruennichi]
MQHLLTTCSCNKCVGYPSHHLHPLRRETLYDVIFVVINSSFHAFFLRCHHSSGRYLYIISGGLPGLTTVGN